MFTGLRNVPGCAAFLPKQIKVEQILLENTFIALIPIKRESLWIMQRQYLPDVCIHRKRLQHMQPEQADAVGYFASHPAAAQ